LSAGETTGSSAAVICFTTFSCAFVVDSMVVAKQMITTAATKAACKLSFGFMLDKNCKHSASESYLCFIPDPTWNVLIL